MHVLYATKHQTIKKIELKILKMRETCQILWEIGLLRVRK